MTSGGDAASIVAHRWLGGHSSHLGRSLDLLRHQACKGRLTVACKCLVPSQGIDQRGSVLSVRGVSSSSVLKRWVSRDRGILNSLASTLYEVDLA